MVKRSRGQPVLSTPSGSGFLPVQHPDFRTLPWQQQCHIVSLYTFHPAEYQEQMVAMGFSKDPSLGKGLAKRDIEEMAVLATLGARELPVINPAFPLQVVRYWAGYRCWYDYEHYSEADARMWGIRSHHIVNVQVLDLPLLVLDAEAALIWSFLTTWHPLRSCAVYLRWLVLMRAAAESQHLNTRGLQSPAILKQLHLEAVELADQLRSLEDLNGHCPLILEEATSQAVGHILDPRPPFLLVDRRPIPQRFALLNKPQRVEHHVYLPVVPEWFYRRDERFSIREWSLLR